MKHNLLSLFLLLFLGSNLFAQKTIFVKHDAAGANDGTSWANAYTSLQTALTAAVAGDQVWVAAGKYTPSGAANASFPLLAGVQLYGGFNGTESTLGARNPATNLTTLSGDITGDDIAFDFTQLRTDNSQHVILMSASANPADRAVVDGFTISGGQTLNAAPNPDLTRRGGGILAVAKLTVRNCHFTDNSADSGSGVAAVGNAASGVLIDNCVFDKNRATAASCGIFFRDLNGAELNKCQFKDNAAATRGCGYILTSVNVVIDSCLYENNTTGVTTNDYAAALFLYTTRTTITNTVFRNNKAGRASAIYADGRDGNGDDLVTINNCLFENNNAAVLGGCYYSYQATSLIKNTTFRTNEAANGACIFYNGSEHDNAVTIDSCLFDKNKTTSYGGTGIYAFKGEYYLNNSVFLENTAPSNAPGIYNADSVICVVKGCLFEANASPFGAGVANFGGGILGTYENCTFLNNKAVSGGGSMINGFEAYANIVDCLFEGNKANYGGAMFIQNDYTNVDITGSTFFNNQAAGTSGSGAGVLAGSGNILNVDDCLFSLNSGTTGGALYIDEDSLDLAKAYVTNTIFSDNFATTQAAAVNISNADVFFTNCLFSKNLNQGTGAGGAISNNASGDKTSPVSLINCTLEGNVATIGCGIAQWEDATSNSITTLQNTILYNPSGANYEVEDGAPEIISSGGNLSGDATLSAELTGTNDQNDADPLFVDRDNYDYHLAAGSPCIDKGVAAGAPAVDIEGVARNGKPDQGAYEVASVGTHQPGAQALELRLVPNPTVERSFLQIENDWSGEVNVRVFNQAGALVRDFTFLKSPGAWSQSIDVRNLPVGIYLVRAQANTQVYEGQIVKQ